MVYQPYQVFDSLMTKGTKHKLTNIFYDEIATVIISKLGETSKPACPVEGEQKQDKLYLRLLHTTLLASN